ncbi:MAG: hypothetical protein LBD97_09565 [Bifidobacteriaceae bacterium]|jgi:hypothetical protein|nr:hypothetical protein [Bifidobacteriaceae bacterium]
MSERVRAALRLAGTGLAVVACVALALWAKNDVGWSNLGWMLLGLSGLVALLYRYNRSQR